MSVLAIVPLNNGRPTKGGLEAASYAAAFAKDQGLEAVALVAGSIQTDGGLGATGVVRVLQCSDELTDSSQWTRLAAAAALECGAKTVVLTHDHTGRSSSSHTAYRA